MIYPQKFGIRTIEKATYDIVTEAHICNIIKEQFGKRIFFGTAIAKDERVDGKTCLVCCEKQFRSFIKDVDNVVEIGTKFGVSSVLLAHYAYHLTTIDIVPRTEPMRLWDYFGVSPKITYAVVLNNEEKREYLKDRVFDFAFIDGNHSYEGVKLDFELTKKCGRVLFHDYSFMEPVKDGVMKFVNELPKNEITINEPFAYWEKR